MKRNLTLLTDLYQLTMMQGYFESGVHERIAVYDLFYRTNPFGSGYSIVCGLEQALEYVRDIHFGEEEIAYLRSTELFREPFLAYLKDFRFTGEIWAIPEGTVVFPQEPLLRVKAPIIEAQFVETTLLTIINHQSLIATKASRVVWAAAGDAVSDFGLRRAQGPDAGIYGARAAFIGGVHSTSNVLAGQMFDIPVMGTHAHSWVMSFEDEYEAFAQYAKLYPTACTLLVDTYDTIHSGVPNAIKVFDTLKGKVARYGIRLDSGDLAYLSKTARKMLDEAGHENAFISASSDLDENFISDLKLQGAKIDVWGVGTKLITAYDCPAFGGIYKLSAEYIGDQIESKIKISENPAKVTNPGFKKVLRFYNKRTGKMKADLIALNEEQFSEEKSITIFDPAARWKQMTFKAGEFSLRELLQPAYKDGTIIAEQRSCAQIREYCAKEMDCLWAEHRRLINPHIYPVDLSEALLDLKEKLIEQVKGIR